MKEVEGDAQWAEDPHAQFTEPDEEAGTESNSDGEANPFSQELAPGVSLIVHMRIYDVLVALLRESNKEVAEKLVELHASGKILGPLPVFDEGSEG